MKCNPHSLKTHHCLTDSMHGDFTGWNPTAPAGAHFRVGASAWADIHFLITDLCSDLVDADMLLKMQSSDGAGPKDEAVCLEMAERLGNWMEQRKAEQSTTISLSQHAGLFSIQPELGQSGFHDFALLTPHVHYPVAQWIEFLRHCRGFEVW